MENEDSQILRTLELIIVYLAFQKFSVPGDTHMRAHTHTPLNMVDTSEIRLYALLFCMTTISSSYLGTQTGAGRS